MSTPKLIFFPEAPDQILDNSLIIDELVAIKLIESNTSTGQYLTGENFLNLITFLGCSPNINLHPVKNEPHCYISLLEQSSTPLCRGFTSTVNPKCPDCKKRIANWKTEHWKNTEEICLCDKCGTETPYSQLNWKHECGFSRCGFEITHIYPHEAVPTEQLINTLEKNLGLKWSYCYANQQ